MQKLERSTRVPCPENDSVKANVTGFSKSGEIAFATAENYGTITFKLDLGVWSGDRLPQIGEIVILSEMAKFQKGWRAGKARHYTLADEANVSE